jgi:hypothetical protein
MSQKKRKKKGAPLLGRRKMPKKKEKKGCKEGLPRNLEKVKQNVSPRTASAKNNDKKNPTSFLLARRLDRDGGNGDGLTAVARGGHVRGLQEIVAAART